MLRYTKAAALALAAMIGVVIAVVIALAAVVGTMLLAQKWLRWRAVVRFRREWHPKGKDLLLVYSNSPHWQLYVEEHWLPNWDRRAVVLNWSESDRRGRTAGVRMRRFSEPLLDRVSSIRSPSLCRRKDDHTWSVSGGRSAISKHGKDQPLRLAEMELESMLARTQLDV
jgi:hypothetical protein